MSSVHSDTPLQTPGDVVTRFLQFACWDHHTHGAGDHRMYDRAAQRILAPHSDIARHSLYTAIVCGDLTEVRRIVAERPEAARDDPDWSMLDMHESQPHELPQDDAAARHGAARGRPEGGAPPRSRRRHQRRRRGVPFDAARLRRAVGTARNGAFTLERGADRDATGAEWATPLAWARKKSHHRIAADLH